MILLTALLCITVFRSVASIANCITSEVTCPLNNSLFSLPPKSLLDWEECRDLCNEQSNCTSFTFYSEKASLFHNMCFLFEESCSDGDLVNCESCVFGYQCSMCSIEKLTFSADGGNFISMHTSMDEKNCSEQCKNTSNCSYYTIHFEDSDIMPNTCVLMSALTEPVSCKHCRTGPTTCDSSAQCKPNEAVIMKSNSNPATHALIEKDETVNVQTMGCQAKANFLLVGGGGTGGENYRVGNMLGGGGSGYINNTAVHIPFSVQYDIRIGHGAEQLYSSQWTYYGPPSANQSSMPGEQTEVYDNFGNLVLEVQGGDGGHILSGGNGYSGGGCAEGKNGGMGGGDGIPGNNECKGGKGSGFNIDSVQHLFEHYELVAAKGSNGDPNSLINSYGGGGGGIQIQTTNPDDEVARLNGASYSYGQGGDGDGSNARGNKGLVLIEIQH